MDTLLRRTRQARGKRAQFLELDLMVALIILFSSIALAKVLYINTIDGQRLDAASQDAAQALRTRTVGELEPAFLHSLENRLAAEPLAAGIVLDPAASVARQAAVLMAESSLRGSAELASIAEDLVKDALSDVIPPEFSYNVTLSSASHEQAIVSSPGSIRDVASQSRLLLSGIEIGQPVTGYTGAVYLSSGQTRRSSYATFGGFVGQGNISVRLDIPADASIIGAALQGDFHDDFILSVNDQVCMTVDVPEDPNPYASVTVRDISACLASFHNGRNDLAISFLNGRRERQFVGGGYIRADYMTTAIYEPRTTTVTQYLPGIVGTFNLYDALTIPGELVSLEARLHYVSNHDDNPNTIFFALGDQRFLNDSTSTTEQDMTITDAQFDALLDYDEISRTTVPLRFGYTNVEQEIITGRLIDSVLITDVSGSMDWNFTHSVQGIARSCADPDLNLPSSRRISVARCVDGTFVQSILDSNAQNRVGLVSYTTMTHSTTSLSSDVASLQGVIGGYIARDYTCIACGIADATALLAGSPEENYRSLLVMSDGEANYCFNNGTACGVSMQPSCSCTETRARNQAIEYARRAREAGVEVYAVAFGNSAGATTMTRIARVNDGDEDGVFGEVGDEEGYFFSGRDPSDLISIYDEIAQRIISRGQYNAQVVTLNATGESTLFNDSFVRYTYTPNNLPDLQGTLLIDGEMRPFTTADACNSQPIYFPLALTPVEGRVVSYSGSSWTDYLDVNGIELFNLTDYGENYRLLGDPFPVTIPSGTLNQGPNTITLRTADDPDHEKGCSPANTLLYTAAISSIMSLDQVYPEAEGCRWRVDFPQGQREVLIPASYTGSNTCSYMLGDPEGSYDPQDAMQAIGYLLFSSFDVQPRDGLLEVDFDANDLEINLGQQAGIPYLWGPAILEVVVWQ
jgi:hypothetical protein